MVVIILLRCVYDLVKYLAYHTRKLYSYKNYNNMRTILIDFP